MGRQSGVQKQGNTEQAIMTAAEELFLERGYHLATTTMIAEKAGVTHAMLHYYFRTKEQIFGQVLEKYINEILESFQPVMKKDAPFWETMEMGISTHFDFLARHPQIPAFIFDVLRFNPELIESYKERFMQTAWKVVNFHCTRIRQEMEAGNIKEVDPIQLLIDIATLNISAFLMLTAARNYIPADGDAKEKLLSGRKKEIISLIKARLYGDLDSACEEGPGKTR